MKLPDIILLSAITFGISTLIIWSAYDNLFSSATGYIYDPSTDELYEVEIETAPLSGTQWRNLLPLVPPPYWQLGFTQPTGKLTEFIDLQQKLPARDREYPQFDREFGWLREDFDDNCDLAAEWPRHDVDPKTLLPPQWQRLKKILHDIDRPNINSADVVIGTCDYSKVGPTDFKIIRSALILFPAAAHIVNEFCFAGSYVPDSWEECWHDNRTQ